VDWTEGATRNISAKIFVQWKSFEVFETDFERFCQILAARAGLSFEVNSNALRSVHSDWIQECEHWVSCGKMPEDTNELSHFKTVAILLRHLCQNPFVTYNESQLNEAWREFYGEIKTVSESVQKKILHGQHQYIGWLMMHNLLCGIEQHREDKKTQFVSRITDDFETDFTSFLISGLYTTSDALYMVIKALFLRD